MLDYNFGLGEFPLYLFNEGTNYKAYETLGVHKFNNGWRFAVWAPNAESVSVACDRNSWTGDGMHLERAGGTGVWYGWFSDITEGEAYKYRIVSNGKAVLKADPFAFEAELRPNTASIVSDIPSIKWTDKKWI